MSIGSKRESYIDSVAGLLTIHMILGHGIQWAHLTDSDGAYLFFQKVLGFFMLWFCFKAGLYFKPKPMLSLIQSSLHRLIIPFLVFSAIGHVTWSCKMLLEGETSWKVFFYWPVIQLLNGGGINGNLPLWFLLTLFTARIIFNRIANRKWFYLLIPIGLIPWALHWSGLVLPLYIANISMAVLFLGLAYLLRPYLQSKWIIIIAPILYLAFMILLPTFVDMRSNRLLYGNYYLWYFVALSGIIVINTIFRLVPYNISILNNIGKNSMAYYCIHWIIITICQIAFILIGVDNYGYVFIFVSMLMSFTLIPIIVKLLEKNNLAFF